VQSNLNAAASAFDLKLATQIGVLRDSKRFVAGFSAVSPETVANQ
jgi:hypothetical protein